MLAVFSHLPVLHMPSHSLQGDLFHDFIRHRGEADWLVIPGSFFLTLLKNKCHISSFPVTGDFTSPILFKYNGLWLSILQLPVLSRPWGEFHHVPWTSTRSGSSDSLRSGLLLWWVAVLRFCDLGDVGETTASEDWDKKKRKHCWVT